MDVSSDNAVLAREQAMQQAQTAAYGKLVEMLTGIPPNPLPTAERIAPLVKGIELEQEKFTSKRYVGLFTVSFKRKELRLFNPSLISALENAHSFNAMTGIKTPENNTAISDSPMPTAENNTSIKLMEILLLPLWRGDDPTRGNILSLWDTQNPWYQLWQQDGRLPLPVGDIADREEIQADQLLQANYWDIERIKNRYHIKAILLAVASPIRVGMGAEGGIALSLRFFDSIGSLQSVSVDIPAGSDSGVTWQQTKEEALRLLETLLTKAIIAENKNIPEPVIQKTTPSLNNFRVNLSTQMPWKKRQEEIKTIVGVKTVKLSSINRSMVGLDIAFSGDMNLLIEQLQQRGWQVSAQDNRTIHID
ncbi:MAG: hypothetical protein ACOYK8_02845 [Alphaproteobacteria bacterium]